MLFRSRRKSKYYTVSFYLGNGSTNAAYKKLTKSVEEGTYYTLPSVPSRTGYVNLGWSTTKNGKSSTAKKAGTKIKIAGNIKYYAVQMQSVSVNLTGIKNPAYRTDSGMRDQLCCQTVNNRMNQCFLYSDKSRSNNRFS